MDEQEKQELKRRELTDKQIDFICRLEKMNVFFKVTIIPFVLAMSALVANFEALLHSAKDFCK